MRSRPPSRSAGLWFQGSRLECSLCIDLNDRPDWTRTGGIGRGTGSSPGTQGPGTGGVSTPWTGWLSGAGGRLAGLHFTDLLVQFAFELKRLPTGRPGPVHEPTRLRLPSRISSSVHITDTAAK